MWTATRLRCGQPPSDAESSTERCDRLTLLLLLYGMQAESNATQRNAPKAGARVIAMVDCIKVCRRHLTFSRRWHLPQATIHVINVCPTAMFNLCDSLRSGYHPAECLLRIQIMLPDMHPLPRFCGRPSLLLHSPGCRSGPLRACMRLHGTEQNHPSRARRKSSSSTYVQSLLGKESRRNTPIPSHYSTSWCS